MPDNVTPPGDSGPVLAPRHAARPRTLSERLAARGTRGRAHEAARADGIRKAKAARIAAAADDGSPLYIGGPAHLSMPASVPITDPDPIKDPEAPALDLFGADFFDSMRVIDGEPAAPTGLNLMYLITETMSHAIMPDLYRRGWCPIPQQRRGKRAPEGGITYSAFKKKAPTWQMVDYWSNVFPSSNVALMMGTVSHNIFALDLDIDRDHPLYLDIAAVIREHLGFEFVRFGRKGFVMLLRAPAGVTVRSRSFVFAKPRGEDESPGMLEILGDGKLVTGFGHHHQTGAYFQWGMPNPLVSTPLRARETTMAELDALIAAIAAVLPFQGSKGSGSQGCPQDPDGIVTYDALPDVDGAYMPRIDIADERWVSDGERVVNGRRKLMLVHSMSLIGGNANMILGDATDQRWRGIIAPALAAVLAAVRTDSKRDANGIRDHYLALIESTVRRFKDGDLKPWALHQGPDGTRVKAGRLRPTAEATVNAASLSWLGSPRNVPALAPLKGGVAPASIRLLVEVAATEEMRAARNLDVDRAIERARIAAKTDAALDDFIISALAGQSRIDLLDGPTGSGKSTRALAKVLPALTKGDDERPVLFVMPTHANLAEAAEVAKTHGFHFETGDAAQELATLIERRLEALGIPAVTWKSKDAAGCRMGAVAKMLNEASIGTGNLCRALSKIPGADGERKFDECKHMQECLGDGYQAMKAKAKVSKVILLSHYWLTAPVLPEELKECRAVIIDESILFKVASTGWLPRSAFDLARPIPAMQNIDRIEMRAQGGSRMPESAVHDRWVAEAVGSREYAARLAQRGIDERWDLTRLATEFAKDKRGVDAVRMQCRILQDAMSHGSKVRPNIGTAEITRLVEHARPRFLALERRFWVTVQGLVLQIRADANPARKAGTPLVARRNAVGTLRRDTRLQAIQQPADSGTPEWGYRVSWRATINWGSAPTLMLDASADKEIVERLYPGREVVHHHVPPGLLNLRTVLIADATYSGSSLDPRPQGDDGDEARALAAAHKKVGIRKLLELASTSHGHGRVLFGAAKKVRELIMRTWTHPPVNIDEVHYGAQRGLDFAKDHLCAVSVGRSEMPIWLVDGLAAALTWDMDEPEEPYDKRGDGLKDDGKPLMRQGVTRMVQRRDGSDVGLSVPMVPGTFGRKVDAQWRDEELSQFRGRLRPVYRDEPATWICVSSVFPEGVIADALLTLDEATATWSPVMSAQAIPGIDGVVALGVTDRINGVTTAQVEAFLATHADDPGYRDVSWSTQSGDIRTGLVSASRDPEEALPAPIERAVAFVGPPKVALSPSRAREPDAVVLARPSAEERERQGNLWKAWFAERRAAGDETVTQHPLSIAVMLRHREDPPGYVPQEPAVEVEPVAAPDVAEPAVPLPVDSTRQLLAETFPGAEILRIRSLVNPCYTPMPDGDPPPDDEDTWTPPPEDWRVSPGSGMPGPC